MAEMVQASHALTVATRGKGFTEITRELARWLESIASGNGLAFSLCSSAIPRHR
jgi:thiamine phosphate synthase YjbQ (UPF0047 family)